MMKNNSIYWKTSCSDNAKDILKSLNDKYLVIRLAERKNNRIKTISQFDSGMQYSNAEGLQKQLDWFGYNSIKNPYQFYTIQSV